MASSDSTSPPPALYFAYGSNLSPTQMAARCPSSPLLGVARLDNYAWRITARGYANVVAFSRLQHHPPLAGPNVIQPRPASAAPLDLGLANPSASSTSSITGTAPATSSAAPNATVWGLLYALPAGDEPRLDRAEGVPGCYGKEFLPVRWWPLDPRAPHAPRAATAALRDVPDPFHPAEGPPGDGGAESEEGAGRDLRPAEGEGAAVVPAGRADVETEGQLAWALVYVDRERIAEGVIQGEYVRRMRRGVAEAAERGVPVEWMGRVIEPWLRE